MRAAGWEMARALVRWQHAAGQYWPYVCAAPFLGNLAIRPSAPARAASALPLTRLLRELPATERTAVFVDLPATAMLPAATALGRLGFLPVPVIQRWISADAMLPCERLVEQLASYRPHRGTPQPARGVVFLLDGERAGPVSAPGRSRSLRLFDNRYSYSLDRFPPPSFLESDGVAAVHWISTRGVAQDLVAYAQRLAEVGLTPVEDALAALLLG